MLVGFNQSIEGIAAVVFGILITRLKLVKHTSSSQQSFLKKGNKSNFSSILIVFVGLGVCNLLIVCCFWACAWLYRVICNRFIQKLLLLVSDFVVTGKQLPRQFLHFSAYLIVFLLFNLVYTSCVLLLSISYWFRRVLFKFITYRSLTFNSSFHFHFRVNCYLFDCMNGGSELYEVWALFRYIEREFWWWFQSGLGLAGKSPAIFLFLVHLYDFWAVGTICWFDSIVVVTLKDFGWKTGWKDDDLVEIGASVDSGSPPESGNFPAMFLIFVGRLLPQFYFDPQNPSCALRKLFL